MPTLILDAVPLREAASAVGVNALMRSVGTTLAAAVMATLLTSSTVQLGELALPTESAFRWCFALGALAAFAGAAIAAFVPRREAVVTEQAAPVAAGSARSSPSLSSRSSSTSAAARSAPSSSSTPS